LQALIDQPALRSAMGRKGRHFIDAHYNIEKLNSRLVKLYEQLLDESKPRTTQAALRPETKAAGGNTGIRVSSRD
jgi:colanic acid/amylovoran biosynthesis glycosyltransferase